MGLLSAPHSVSFSDTAAGSPTILVGITHPQTCLVLGSRLRALRMAGFRVVLVASPGELLDRTAQKEGVERIGIPMERGIAPIADLVSLLRLIVLLFRIRPEIVEFSTPKAGLLGMLAATLCGVKRRVYLLRGLKLERAKGLKRKLLLGAEFLSCACAHQVLCNSESLLLEALGLHIVSPNKVRMLGDGSSQGVDLSRFSPGPGKVRARLGWASENRVIGFVGRFTRDKGIPELIEAFESIATSDPFARLLLVGWFDRSEDALDPSLRLRIQTNPRIHCTGMVHDTAPYYRAMDVLVLPTWREGFPNVVLEAQATGIPVVTTICTGSRDSVVPEVTGLLIPPGYPEAICESVWALLRDPLRRQRMGQAARAWVSEHYSDHRVLGLTADFYQGLLGSEPFASNRQEREFGRVPALAK